MTRRLLAAGAALLLGQSAAGGAMTPQEEYTAFLAGLGAAGGGALGASIGAISVPKGSNSTKPALRWGAVGAAFGAYLGREIAVDALLNSEIRRNVSYATRDSNSCLGAIGGGVLGLAAGSLVRALGEGDERSTWGGIIVGSMAGASFAFMLPPIALVPPPPKKAERERLLSREMKTLEPLVPGSVPQWKPSGLAQPLAEGPAQRSRLGELGFSRLETEDPVFIRSEASRKIFPAPRFVAPSPLPPPDVSRHVPSVFLSAVEGAILGASLAGSAGDDDEDFWMRTLLGGALGSLAGSMASIMLIRPEPGADEGAFLETGAVELQNRRISAMMAGGMLGGILGAAAGTTMHNTQEGFTKTKIARMVLSGSLAGQIAGYVICSRSF